MKNQDDEPSLRIVLIALIIIAITIAVFLIPPTPLEAPAVELQEFPAVAEAAAMEVPVVVEEQPPAEIKPALRSELVRVCSCESTGNPNSDPTKYHYESDGVTLLTGRVNPADKGMCQINMDAHGSEIERLGLDIFKSEDDYIEYTNRLYDTQGLAPWRYSKHCWQK